MRKDCLNGWGIVIPRFLEKFVSEVSLQKKPSAVACQMGPNFEGIKLDAKMHGKILRNLPYTSALFGLVIHHDPCLNRSKSSWMVDFW